MDSILYGSTRITLVSGVGTRLERSNLLLRDPVPRRPSAPVGPPLLGREEPLGAAWRDIRAGRSVEFHGPCGLGKSSLLREIAAGDMRCAYVRVGRNPLGDTLQLIVDQLYLSTEPVRFSRRDCELLIGHSGALLVLDEVPPRSRVVRELAAALPGCVLVVAGQRPVLGGLGSSRALPGLPWEACLDLFARGLGRSVTEAELPFVQRLLEAVGRRPLHVRQAAALVRAGERSVRELAELAERDPAEVDRLSIRGLSGPERSALAVLALVGGVLVTGSWVGAVGDLTYAAQVLVGLHERGLAERPEPDRFGLPVCLTESYREALLGVVSIGTAVNGLADWLDNAAQGRANGVWDLLEGAEGVVGLLGFAAERQEWEAVVRLAKPAEALLFAARRWDQWRDVLEQGLDAARRTGDRAAEALFAHELGTVAYVEDRPADARTWLRQALELRLELADHEGAELTRANLDLVAPPPPRRPPWRKAILGAAAVLALLVGVAAVRHAVHPDDDKDAGQGRPAPSGTSAPRTPGGPATPNGAVGGTTTSGSTGGTASSGGSTRGSTDGNKNRILGDGDGTTSSEPTTGDGTTLGGTSSPEQQPGSGIDWSSLAFGDVVAGGESDPVTVTVRSTGSAPLVIRQAGLSDTQAFAVTGDQCSGTELDTGGSCTIQVVFRPQDTGTWSAQLRIPDDSADGGHTVGLSGTGTPKPAPAAEVGPARIDFPGTSPGDTSDPVTITVTSTGTADLEIGTIGIDDAADFVITQDGCSRSRLPAGDSCAVEVVFRPAGYGAFSANVTVPDDTTQAEHVVTVSGTAEAG
ncbi:choice-of-anchor D domain-containing protein [Streptomyces sp. NPDC048282]|uniref:choice-of-anchor D domain-containing protein n=1 Tax=Streptomyces sp. NPDC048282 TaxID=3365528 RepID=UPI0037140398